MLVLTRKYQEKIRIGDSITITVLRSKGKAVRLGIEAPADVPVIRGELLFDVSPQELTREIRGGKALDGSAVKCRVQGPGAATNWTTESNPKRNVRCNEPEVSLRRVPRDEVAQVLPELIARPRSL